MDRKNDVALETHATSWRACIVMIVMRDGTLLIASSISQVAGNIVFLHPLLPRLLLDITNIRTKFSIHYSPNHERRA